MEKREALNFVGRNISTGIMENSMSIPQRITNIATIWVSDFTFGYTAKGNEFSILKRHLHSQIL